METNEQQTPETPAPSAEDARISAIEQEIEGINQQIVKAGTSREWRQLTERRSHLDAERTGLQLKPVIERKDESQSESKSKGAPQPSESQHDFKTDHGYALEVPSMMPESEITEESTIAIEEYSVLSKEMGLAPDAAQMLLETVVESHLSLPEGMTPAVNRAESLSVLHTLWGNQFDQNLKLVQDVVKANPKLAHWLNVQRGAEQRALGDDPSVLVSLLAFAKGWHKVTPAQAETRLQKILNDSKSPYWAGEPNLVAEVRALRARASGTAGTASAVKQAVKAPAAPSGRAAVEARIKELKTSPAYWSRDHASHREVVDQVSQLYAQLDGAA